MAIDIINRVRKSISDRDEVIKSLYTDPSIRKAVIGTLVKMGCQEKEAKDCLTDAIVSFIKACYKPDFKITSNLTNYLIGTAKNIWLKGVTKKKQEVTIQDKVISDTEPPIEDTLISQERKALLQQVIDRLDETCRKVITLWSINKRMAAIATELNYKSEGMARKKKHQCMQRLYAIIDHHPHIRIELSTLR